MNNGEIEEIKFIVIDLFGKDIYEYILKPMLLIRSQYIKCPDCHRSIFPFCSIQSIKLQTIRCPYHNQWNFSSHDVWNSHYVCCVLCGIKNPISLHYLLSTQRKFVCERCYWKSSITITIPQQWYANGFL